MLRLKNIILISIFSLFIIQPAQGQLLKNVMNRAKRSAKHKVEERVEKKANEEIDKQIDKGLDKIEESIEKDKEKGEEVNSSESNSKSKADARDKERTQRMTGLLNSFGVSTEPVPIEKNYSFNQLIQMHIESFDKNGNKESEGEFITHLNSNTKSMAYQALSKENNSEQGLFIIDAENSATIILSEDNGEKTGIVYGMNAFFKTMGESYSDDEEYLAETPETYMANPDVKKTGRTKTIAGYKCEEYIHEDESSKSHIWITKKLKLNTEDFLSAIFKTSIAAHGMGWGYMMESTSVDKETGEKSIMKVTRVDKNSNVKFSLSDYEITNLGSINLPTGEEE